MDPRLFAMEGGMDAWMMKGDYISGRVARGSLVSLRRQGIILEEIVWFLPLFPEGQLRCSVGVAYPLFQLQPAVGLLQTTTRCR